MEAKRPLAIPRTPSSSLGDLKTEQTHTPSLQSSCWGGGGGGGGAREGGRVGRVCRDTGHTLTFLL